MTLTAYARLRNVSLAAIQKRIKNGTITERAVVRSNGKIVQINSTLADNDFKRNGDHVQSLAQKASKELNKVKHEKEQTSSSNPPLSLVPEEQPSQEEKPKSEFADAKAPKNTIKKEVVNNQEVEVEQAYYNHDLDRYKKAKASTEELKARKIEFEVLEMEGKLVDIEDVKRVVAKLVTETKDTILNVPSKVGPDLLACNDLVELENKLTEALNNALLSLSRLDNAQFSK